MGGVEVIIRQLLDMQMTAGHRVTLVYSSVHGGDDRAIGGLPAGVELIRWDAVRAIDPAEDFRALRKLVVILGELRPDIVHLHNSKAGAHGRIACRWLGLRSIYSAHGPAYLRNDIGTVERLAYYSIEWTLCLLGDRLIASSQSELKAMRFLPGAKRLINNGVNPCLVQKGARARSPVVAHSGRFRIVLCGRIWPQKNPQFVSELATASPEDWEWIWIGDGHLRSVLDANPRINVLGWQPPNDTLATVQSADIYLQPSRWEGMSFAVLEAMSLARPCVVSNVTGNRDLVRNGISGFVCDNQGEYLTALHKLAVDADLRRRLGDGAAREVATSFSLEQAVRNWSALYRSMLPSNSNFEDFRSATEAPA